MNGHEVDKSESTDGDDNGHNDDVQSLSGQDISSELNKRIISLSHLRGNATTTSANRATPTAKVNASASKVEVSNDDDYILRRN